MVMDKRTGGVFLPNQPSSIIVVSSVSLSVSLSTWHNHLGHLSLKNLRKILSSMNISFSSSQFQKFSCNSCNINRSHKLPFSTSSISFTSPLEVVYYDVWTSPILSVDGFKCYVIFVDHFTKYVWFYPFQ